jgi:hypothetical protein
MNTPIFCSRQIDFFLGTAYFRSPNKTCSLAILFVPEKDQFIREQPEVVPILFPNFCFGKSRGTIFYAVFELFPDLFP